MVIQVIFCLFIVLWIYGYVYDREVSDFLSQRTVEMQKRYYWENFFRFLIVIIFLYLPLLIHLLDFEVFNKYELILCKFFIMFLGFSKEYNKIDFSANVPSMYNGLTWPTTITDHFYFYAFDS